MAEIVRARSVWRQARAAMPTAGCSATSSTRATGLWLMIHQQTVQMTTAVFETNRIELD